MIFPLGVAVDMFFIYGGLFTKYLNVCLFITRLFPRAGLLGP